MQITHEEQKKKGTFFIEKNGNRLAELVYFRSAPGRMTIYHTEVSEKLRGSGKGKGLVVAAAEFARENDLKIIPTCPFAKKVLDATPEFRDVIAQA